MTEEEHVTWRLKCPECEWVGAVDELYFHHLSEHSESTEKKREVYTE